MTDKVAGSTAKERLQEAAIAMFQSRGYEAVTAAQIAAAAGVTERTFFRYFPDKREVLFGAEDMVREAVLAGIRDAPARLGSLDALFHAYRAFAPTVEARRGYAKPRQDLIDAHPALQERELAKVAALAKAIASGMEDRGTDAVAAELAARVGMTAIVLATNHWLADGTIPLADHLDRARHTLRQLAS